MKLSTRSMLLMGITAAGVSLAACSVDQSGDPVAPSSQPADVNVNMPSPPPSEPADINVNIEQPPPSEPEPAPAPPPNDTTIIIEE